MSRFNKESQIDDDGFRFSSGRGGSRGGRGGRGGRGRYRGGYQQQQHQHQQHNNSTATTSRFASFASEQQQKQQQHQQQPTDHGETEHQQSETSGSYVGPNGMVYTEKVQIPHGSAAYVIGKSGANVKRMMQMGAKCSVKDTVVLIQSSNRAQCQAAKKTVLELLKSYISRKQTQVNTLNLLSIDDRVGPLDSLLDVPKSRIPRVDLQEREGPLNSFEKLGEEKTYFELKWTINEDEVVEAIHAAAEEDDDSNGELTEEDEMLRALAQMRTGVKFKASETSAAHKEKEKEKSAYQWTGSDDAGLVQRLELVNDTMIKEKPLKNMGQKIYEYKQRQVTKHKYAQLKGDTQPRKISFQTEVVIGHKLFFLNDKPLPGEATSDEQQEGDKIVIPRAQKQVLQSNLQHQHIKDLLKLKIGYNQQLNSMFNSALSEQEIDELKHKITTDQSSFKLVEKHVVIFITVSQVVGSGSRPKRRKYDLQCTVVLPEKGINMDADQHLLPIRVNRSSDKNFKLMVLDVVRTQSKFDYRIRAKTFQTEMLFNELAVQFIEEGLQYDAKNHVLIEKEPRENEEAENTATVITEPSEGEEGEDDDDLNAPWNYRMEYRRRYEDIYSNGQFKLLFRRKEEEETRFNELKNRSDKMLKSQQPHEGDDEEEEQQQEHKEEGETMEEEDVNEEEAAAHDEEGTDDRRKMVILEVTVFSEQVDRYGDASNVVVIKEPATEEESEEKQEEEEGQEEEQEEVDPELVALQQTTEEEAIKMLHDLADFLHKTLLD